MIQLAKNSNTTQFSYYPLKNTNRTGDFELFLLGNVGSIKNIRICEEELIVYTEGEYGYWERYYRVP